MSKKLYTALIAVLAAVIVAAAALIMLSSRGGASAPAEAVWGYLKASMLYDAEGMINYSSPYNTDVLSDANPSSGSVEDYLKLQYSGSVSIYADSELTCSSRFVKEISKDDETYAELFADYLKRIPESEEPQAFATVSLEVFSDGAHALYFPGYAVKFGGRWYYFKPVPHIG